MPYGMPNAKADAWVERRVKAILRHHGAKDKVSAIKIAKAQWKREHGKG